MSSTVLITGVAGFLGRYVARHFHGQGWKVIGIDSAPPENAPLADLSAYFGVLLPSRELDSLLEKHTPDLCVHCAGRASINLSISDPASDFHAGPVLTFEILNALRLRAPQCRFLFMSSAAVYGNPEVLPVKETHAVAPILSYGFHKRLCEQLCVEFAAVYGMRTASLRIFSAYGTGLRRQVIWDICRKALAERKLVLQGTGRESRDFVHASDIASALEIAAKTAPMRGEAYNLATGREVTIADLARMILKTLKIDGVPDFDGIVPAGTPLNWRADISLLSKLGFSPSIPLEQGVQSVVNWCREELKGL